MGPPESRTAEITDFPFINEPGGTETFNMSRAGSFAAPFSRPLKQQLHRVLEVISVMSVDLGAMASAFAAAYLVRMYLLPALSDIFPAEMPHSLPANLWWLPLVAMACLAYEGLYTRRFNFWRECGCLIRGVSLAYLITMAVVILTKAGDEVSRTFIVLSWLFSLLLLPIFRYTGKRALANAGIWKRRVLLLGALNSDPYMGYQVVGVLDDDPAKKKKTFTINGGARVKVLGGFRDSDQIMAKTGVYNLIVAAPGIPPRELVGLVNRLQRICESVMVVPDLFGMPVMGAEADYFFDERFLGLRLKNNLASGANIFLKRAFDLTAGSFILVLLLPIMTLIALAVKAISPGPAVFTQQRIGRRGKVFLCYKFRTMYMDNEDILKEYLAQDEHAKYEWDKYAKLKGRDPRVAPVGRLLRKFSLDELPQIFNVLKGEMSLVGPRPYLPREKGRMSNSADTILMARPGITGLWQVSGRNDIDFEGRLTMDTWYVRNWSLWLDITLLIRTVAVVLGRKGAY